MIRSVWRALSSSTPCKSIVHTMIMLMAVSDLGGRGGHLGLMSKEAHSSLLGIRVERKARISLARSIRFIRGTTRLVSVFQRVELAFQLV